MSSHYYRNIISVFLKKLLCSYLYCCLYSQYFVYSKISEFRPKNRIEVFTGRIFQTRPGPPRNKKKICPSPARKRNWNLGPSPAWPERKIEISARVRPAWIEKQNLDPGPVRPIFFPISAQTAWFKWF